MSQLFGYIAQDTTEAGGEGTDIRLKASKMGFLIVQDFYTQMAIEGRVYQVRAGDIATPLLSDVPLIDTKAEFCVDTTSGTTVIPAQAVIGITLLPGTVNQAKIQSVGVVSSAGTAFVPLPLYMGGTASTSSARVTAAGGVTVTAEAATSTRLHFSFGSGTADTLLSSPAIWAPKAPPILAGPACLYVQIGATGTAAQYYGSIDFIEIPTTAVS